MHLDWDIDDPPAFNNDVNRNMTIQDITFYLSITKNNFIDIGQVGYSKLIRFVNSTGFLHQVDDLYRWTANLIRGTGAVMGISIVPNVTLNELNVAAALTTTTASTRTTTVASNSTTFTFESSWMRRLADKCKMINDMGIPVLLRFAPDMNGMFICTTFYHWLNKY